MPFLGSQLVEPVLANDACGPGLEPSLHRAVLPRASFSSSNGNLTVLTKKRKITDKAQIQYQPRKCCLQGNFVNTIDTLQLTNYSCLLSSTYIMPYGSKARPFFFFYIVRFTCRSTLLYDYAEFIYFYRADPLTDHVMRE